MNSPLTKKQREVVDLLAQGYTAREIGKRLGITTASVHNRSKAARWKLKAHNTAHLIALTKGSHDG